MGSAAASSRGHRPPRVMRPCSVDSDQPSRVTTSLCVCVCVQHACVLRVHLNGARCVPYILLRCAWLAWATAAGCRHHCSCTPVRMLLRAPRRTRASRQGG